MSELRDEKDLDDRIRQSRIGIARSPSQDIMDENEELERIKRMENHKQHIAGVTEMSDGLDRIIIECVNNVVTDNQTNIDNLSSMFNDNTITPDVIREISDVARVNTENFMFDIIPQLLSNNDSIDSGYISSLTNEIFLFSLMDIVFGYQNPNYNSSNISKINNIFDSLKEDGFIESDETIKQLFIKNINILVRKNISEGKYIKNKNKRTIKFNVGGKTKRRRYKRKKTIKRRVKSKI
jgi:hypothetical protein